MTLTERQLREKEYHVEHAKTHKPYLVLDVTDSDDRWWWNAYWDTWTLIRGLDLKGKKALVVGCGDGGDAIHLARLGAVVDAFDLSPEMLEYGKRLASEHGVSVNFREAVAENMPYPDDSFDLVYVRDILHHVDIEPTMKEIARVAKPGAMMIVNEIYSHSITDRIRYSWIVERVIYPLLRSFVYGKDKPYITADERKMTEKDIAMVKAHIRTKESRYFNFIVARLIPDSFTFACKCDRALLRTVGGLGKYLAGRIVMVGTLTTP